jgi:TonB family protein
VFQPGESLRYVLIAFMSTVLFVPIGLRMDAKTQIAQLTTDSAITELVESMAQPLKNAKAKKVIIFDFRGPNEQLHPVGKWLADQVSMTMRRELPKIETIDSSQLTPGNKIADTSTDVDVVFAAEIIRARSLGADIIMSGTFARVSDQIGVSLSIARMADLGKTQEYRTGLIPISTEITELTPEPIPGLDLKDGIPHAGTAGISMPICTHCPPAEFPRNAVGGGVVHLELVVTTEGRTEKITIIDTPSPELAASAVRAVRGWRFKPAIGFDGKPIAVYAPIQLTFH